ncbi:flavin reductase family protein [Dactylosporangium sp. NPDC050688]|uniref:flavin reductase family protein n=1 Tax=Dactylosporangium sp. NPDC050688 TaxID=3157217 RepID=UPI003404056E
MTPPRPSTAGRPAVDPLRFRQVIGHFASGVAVLTTSEAGQAYGTTVSALCSLSADPPMLLACLHADSATGRAVARTGVLAVNLLAADQADLAHRFARKGGDKFAGMRLSIGDLGLPVLCGALATLQCRVVGETEGGTHRVYLAEVVTVQARPGRPLVYYRGRFGDFHQFDRPAQPDDK